MSETAVAVSEVSLVNLENLVAQNGTLLAQIYTAQLFVIGVVGAGVVLFLLYKFLRKFY